MSEDFATFVLDKLQRQGLAFSELDWGLHRSGHRSWAQLWNGYALSERARNELRFTQASDLAFVAQRPDLNETARVQAKFQDDLGDAYWVCIDASMESLMTEFYAARTWSFVTG